MHDGGTTVVSLHRTQVVRFLEWRPHLGGTSLQDFENLVALLAFQTRTTAGSSSCYVDD